MNQILLELQWKRPSSVDYPKVWRTFKARDLNSDELVEYCIQDLLECQFNDAIDHMVKHYIPDEPMNEAFGGIHNAKHVALKKTAYRSMLHQKTSLACFRVGSDEIVGVQISFVITKGDPFFNELQKIREEPISKTISAITKMPYTHHNFDPFEHYGVTEYYGEFGLSVDNRFKGRNIGYQLLAARKEFCQAFGLKLTSMTFTSDLSNRCADKAGYELNAAMSFDEISKLRPELNIPQIKSKGITIKSMICL